MCVHLVHMFYILYLQLSIRASDNGNPSLFTTVTANINVNRNLNAPIFDTNQNYVFTILETTDPGSSIFKLEASDSDLIVSI